MGPEELKAAIQRGEGLLSCPHTTEFKATELYLYDLGDEICMGITEDGTTNIYRYVALCPACNATGKHPAFLGVSRATVSRIQ